MWILVILPHPTAFSLGDNTFLLLLAWGPCSFPPGFLDLCLYLCKEPFIKLSLIYLNVRISFVPVGFVTNIVHYNTTYMDRYVFSDPNFMKKDDTENNSQK